MVRPLVKNVLNFPCAILSLADSPQRAIVFAFCLLLVELSIGEKQVNQIFYMSLKCYAIQATVRNPWEEFVYMCMIYMYCGTL